MDVDIRRLDTTSVEQAGEFAAIALNAVPVAGGVLAAIATSIVSKRQNRRLNQFLVDLADDLGNFQDRVNADFLQTDEFQDLAEDIFAKAAETRQQEKLDAFRAIFVNTVLSTHPDYDEAAEIAGLVNGWQARHVILIRILANPIAADRQMGDAVGRGGGLTTSISSIFHRLLPEWDDDQIDRTWQELYDAQIHRTSGTKIMLSDQGIHQLENRLSDFGVRVARYLTLPQ